MSNLSYEIYFNGDVDQQCAAATYPECRSVLVKSLENSVEKNHITREEADERLKTADAKWKEAKKKPEVKANLAARKQVLADQCDAILKSCENQLSEILGHEVTVATVDEGDKDDEEEEEGKVQKAAPVAPVQTAASATDADKGKTEGSDKK